MAQWSAQRRIIRTIQQFQPQVIFCHHSLPNGWLVAHLPPAYRRPLFVLEHDYDEIADCYQLPHRRAAMQAVAERATQLMAVSTRMEKDLNALFPEASTATHYNGVDLPPPALASTPRPPELQAKQVILSCALFSERKGMPLLVQAFGAIAANYPNAVLRIIGGGPAEAKVRQTVERLNLRDRVQLLGKQPHERVRQEMAWADGFALVSWDEPFATVYLEAMAAGKPIICCRDGGICDVVKDGLQGYIVTPKDVKSAAQALDRLLTNPSQRQRMGQHAQHLITTTLTWDAQAQALINRFEQALAKL
ncbi:MAG: glycosyltransferase family 4 protein [Leptolyngbyaceae cyanobacterium SM2_5_2]|nr:glycosyltransferase family 4 protein [Leptolyngbyaceae cyanobacterium SM2_5_2]